MSAKQGAWPIAGAGMTETDPERNDRKRIVRGFAFSLSLWALALALATLIPLGKLPEITREYREVSITLAPPRATAVAKQGGSSNSPARSGVSRKTTSASSGPAASAKKATDSPGGLGIPDFAPSSRKSSSAGGTAEYLEFGTVQATDAASGETRPRATAPRTAVPEIEGSVASVKKGTDGPVSATSRTTRGSAATGASSETARELGTIAGSAVGGTGSGAGAGAAAGGTATAGGTGSGSGNGLAGSGSGTGSGVATGSGAGTGTAGSGTGSVSAVSGFAFDGRPRGRLYPATVSIVLPDSLARLVDSNRAVTVNLTVLADGTVPVGLVTFAPEATLPAEIRDYLAREFSRWRFEKSDQDGHARFLYSIRVQ